MWSLPHLVEEVAAILAEREAALAAEQAVRGLDALDEVALHAVLADTLTTRYAVAREVHYPSAQGKLSTRQRCDLVLGPPGGELVPQAALWLEVKVAHQFRDGGQRNSRYAAQWRRALTADLRKMAADPRIESAALAFVAFTADEPTVVRDLTTFERMLGEFELLCGTRSTRAFRIVDRLGHNLVTVAMWPMLRD